MVRIDVTSLESPLGLGHDPLRLCHGSRNAFEDSLDCVLEYLSSWVYAKDKPLVPVQSHVSRERANVSTVRM